MATFVSQMQLLVDNSELEALWWLLIRKLYKYSLPKEIDKKGL